MAYTTEDYFNANEFIADEKKTKFRHKNLYKAMDEYEQKKKDDIGLIVEDTKREQIHRELIAIKRKKKNNDEILEAIQEMPIAYRRIIVKYYIEDASINKMCDTYHYTKPQMINKINEAIVSLETTIHLRSRPRK